MGVFLLIFVAYLVATIALVILTAWAAIGECYIWTVVFGIPATFFIWYGVRAWRGK